MKCYLTSTMVVLYPKEEEMISERHICAPSPPQGGPNGNRPRGRRMPSVLIRTQMPKKCTKYQLSSLYGSKENHTPR